MRTLGRSGRASALARGRGRAVLLAGVSLLTLAIPALSAELSPGGGNPWELDAVGPYTITGADTSAENAWIGVNTPGVILVIDGTAGPASLTIAAGKSFNLGLNGANGATTTMTGSSIVNTATMAVGDQVFVGYGSDDNILTLNAYSSITASSVVLGVNAGSDGNLLELTTGTSTIDLTSNLIVGNDGADNIVTLANGADIDATGQVIVGYNATADGNSLTLSLGSSITADTGAAVGYAGAGNSLTIESGADFTTYTTTLGAQVGADGNSVTVTGAGSTFTGTTNASFNVGDLGKQNTLDVLDGAVFDIGDRLALGKDVASTDNIVTVSGAGSELHAGNVRIGITTMGSSGNSLVVSDGGYVQVDTDIKVRGGNFIELSSGAILDMAGFTTDAGATFVLGVDSSNAIDFDVTGAASLAGTLEANYTGGTLTNRYRVLSAGSLTSTIVLDDNGFAPGFTVTLDQDGDELYLDIAADLGGAADLGENQSNLADALNDAFADGEELSGDLVDLFGLADPALDDALAALTGEINAYAQTELGWSGTEAALDTDLCAPDDGQFCVKAYGAGAIASIEGDDAQGSHDTMQANGTFGVVAARQLGADTLVGGLFSIDQAHADNGLGTADVTGFRFGGRGRQDWDSFYASVGGAGGFGLGHTDRDFTSADFSQAYLGLRGEAGADLALAGSAVVTPFAALDWANTTTSAYSEATADLALAYGDNSQSRTTAELGIRLATAPDATGFVLGGTVAYRHTLAADNAVETSLEGLDDYSFDVSPATSPTDLLTLSADSAIAIGNGTTLTARVDAGFSSGYHSAGGRVGLTGQW